MRRQKKSLTLMEVLISFIILTIIIGIMAASLVSMKRLAQRDKYLYTAINLGREVMEFIEAIRFQHGAGANYYYDNGYKVDHWSCGPPCNMGNLFSFGDIKAKGLVPEKAPDSVRINFRVGWWQNLLKYTTRVIWKEKPQGNDKEIAFGLIPIRAVNNQLQLLTAEFSWRRP